MSEKDKIIIERLLNHDKSVGDEFLKQCSYAINYFIAHYHEKCSDKATLRKELANELYDYVIRKDLLLKFKGKNGCKLSSYLNSIAKFVLPRITLEDPLITKANEKRREEEKKLDKIIRSIDEEPLLFHSYKSTPIPKEFRDEDEAFDAEYLYVGIDEEEEEEDDFAIFDDGFTMEGDDSDDEEEDVVMDIDNFKETFIDNSNNSTIELVRQTLEQMPPKEAILLKKQFYEGYDAKELAKELGHTLNVIYNLKSKAMRDFRTIYTKLKNGLL